MVHADRPPTVELDSEAHAAYIRFSSNKVFKTDPVVLDGVIVTADKDRAGNVIGIELVGVKQFGIRELIDTAGVRGVSRKLQDQAKYVPAKPQTV